MAAVVQGLCALTLSSLGEIVLTLGDNDARKVWSGKVQSGFAGTPITQLQKALIDVGALKGKADGQFGNATAQAIKRFQWYQTSMNYRLKMGGGGLASSGAIVAFSGKPLGNSGSCNKNVATELLAWQKDGFVTTTPLVRLGLSGVSNVSTADSFTVLDYPGAASGEIVVHGDFAGVISGNLNEKAKARAVTLLITQAFRRDDVPPSGAVVSPAKQSQHLVGHAVDLNIMDGDTVNTFSMFKNAKETEAADQFVDDVKKAGLRWGGDFAKHDYVHFDDFLNPSSDDYANSFFFAQNSFHNRHPMRLVAG